MLSALSVSAFYDMTQDIDHNLVVFLFFLHLACNQVDQLALLCIQLDGIIYTLENNTCIKGSADIV